MRFTVELADDPAGTRCNCSICAKKGAVTTYAPLESLTVTQGADMLKVYSFNTGVAKHHFCSHCGIHCFHQTRSMPDKYGVNVACLEGMSPFDFAEVPVVDGIHHPNDNGGVRRLAGKLRFEPSAE
ncbi:GFA family protein [Erythrobacter sp. SG61-1L]|uniref:GFA family protein n=1 Tax=Erythrobacter sp. SG61-1L TaxID=1603897 RepID=UPI001F5203A6|nr:GFA family protein [Erythrobacter sp. SG61-1L]